MHNKTHFLARFARERGLVASKRRSFLWGERILPMSISSSLGATRLRFAGLGSAVFALTNKPEEPAFPLRRRPVSMLRGMKDLSDTWG